MERALIAMNTGWNRNLCLLTSLLLRHGRFSAFGGPPTNALVTYATLQWEAIARAFQPIRSVALTEYWHWLATERAIYTLCLVLPRRLQQLLF